jgi:hypothetical protein
MSCKSLVLLAVTIAFAETAHAADRINPPSVPTTIEVEAGFKPFLVGHAVGTQNYICVAAPTVTGGDWLFIGPQATIFGADVQQTLTHFLSKNPLRGDALHATWQHSRDTSAAWATRLRGSSDPDFVAPDAIEWLLLEVTGGQVGPLAGDKLAGTRFIQRVNTVGGVKPPAGDCTSSTLNARKLVPYEADYYFYQ